MTELAETVKEVGLNTFLQYILLGAQETVKKIEHN